MSAFETVHHTEAPLDKDAGVDSDVSDVGTEAGGFMVSIGDPDPEVWVNVDSDVGADSDTVGVADGVDSDTIAIEAVGCVEFSIAIEVETEDGGDETQVVDGSWVTSGEFCIATSKT